ncbi:MAG: ribosome maturation factor RimP, partial [Eggerthellaceae bacterium]|nr:ribosome maturation factor RimP [Eggerthellaceae bacterium]
RAEELGLGDKLEIVSLELAGSKKTPIVRVFIDCNGGVNFDQISLAQSWINAVMEEIDPFPGSYVLEVSSPGIDCPLRKPEHFVKQLGKKAKLKLVDPLENRGTWAGVIKQSDENSVEIETEEGQIKKFDFKDIRKANLVGEIDFSRKGK